MQLKKSHFFVLLCVASWSLIPVVSKIVTIDVSPLQLLFLSNILSALTLGAMLLVCRSQIDGVVRQLKSSLMATSLPAFLGCFFIFCMGKRLCMACVVLDL